VSYSNAENVKQTRELSMIAKQCKHANSLLLEGRGRELDPAVMKYFNPTGSYYRTTRLSIEPLHVSLANTI
jgi:hypothetical protein